MSLFHFFKDRSSRPDLQTAQGRSVPNAHKGAGTRSDAGVQKSSTHLNAMSRSSLSQSQASPALSSELKKLIDQSLIEILPSLLGPLEERVGGKLDASFRVLNQNSQSIAKQEQKLDAVVNRLMFLPFETGAAVYDRLQQSKRENPKVIAVGEGELSKQIDDAVSIISNEIDLIAEEVRQYKSELVELCQIADLTEYKVEMLTDSVIAVLYDPFRCPYCGKEGETPTQADKDASRSGADRSAHQQNKEARNREGEPIELVQGTLPLEGPSAVGASQVVPGTQDAWPELMLFDAHTMLSVKDSSPSIPKD